MDKCSETVRFFACTIKCGEDWSEQCEKALEKTLKTIYEKTN